MIDIQVSGFSIHQFIVINRWCEEKFGVKQHLIEGIRSTDGVWFSNYSVDRIATYAFLHLKDAVLFSLTWADHETNLHTR